MMLLVTAEWAATGPDTPGQVGVKECLISR